ncbi:MAG: hypothetical protein QNI84_16900 [Henriciella sp.]|nr:hypothetical protein [Henriciella sp.]
MTGRFAAAMACLAVLLSPQPVQAQATESIAGHWSFEARVDPSCSFGGTAHLRRVEDGSYTGELTARQSCEMLEEDYIVRQDCEASVLGNQVSVRCTIVEFVNGFESPFYYPDNFSLTVDTPTRMFGALISAGAPRPAEWTRSDGGIS